MAWKIELSSIANSVAALKIPEFSDRRGPAEFVALLRNLRVLRERLLVYLPQVSDESAVAGFKVLALSVNGHGFPPACASAESLVAFLQAALDPEDEDSSKLAKEALLKLRYCLQEIPARLRGIIEMSVSK